MFNRQVCDMIILMMNKRLLTHSMTLFMEYKTLMEVLDD